MPIQIDDSALLKGLERIAQAHGQAITRGLRDGAAQAEAILVNTHAHGDITGATRASYQVVADVDAVSAASSGLAAAEAALNAAGKEYHGGGALRQTVYTLKQDERGVVYRSFTDYQDKLETDNGGQKAALGPTLEETAGTITAHVASELKDAR